jgi:hypothetical protein
MASSVRPVFFGEDYQHRYFWIQACRLFTEARVVQRVSLEKPIIKAFDDVVTNYAAPRLDAHGRRLDADHFQLKFHVDFRRNFGGLDLTEPRFVNATRRSILQRAADASASGDIPARLSLVTSYRISEDDPLRHLVAANDGEMVTNRLFDDRPRSEMGKLREAWRAHLGGINDDGLERVLRHLRIQDGVTFGQLNERLQDKLALAGLELVDDGRFDDTYLGMSRGFIKARMHDHDALSLEPILREHGRWRGGLAEADGPIELAIRSFPRQSYELEDVARLLDLVPYFHGRETIAGIDWDRDLAPPIQHFLDQQVRNGQYDLHFDAHLSIGYLAGYMLGKTDSDVAPVQRQGRVVWRPTGADLTGPLWADVREVRLGDGPDLAIALEVTRAVSDDVAEYAKRSAPSIGRLLVLAMADGSGDRSVQDGDHASALAQRAAQLIEEHRSVEERERPLHLFAAAPIALMFMVGREGRGFGRTTLYEFDFDTRAPGAYQPSFHLPLP